MPDSDSSTTSPAEGNSFEVEENTHKDYIKFKFAWLTKDGKCSLTLLVKRDSLSDTSLLGRLYKAPGWQVPSEQRMSPEQMDEIVLLVDENIKLLKQLVG